MSPLFDPSVPFLRKEAIDSAMAEGARHKVPSSELVIAKVVTRGDFRQAAEGAVFLFSSVSPFQPAGMKVIFRGDGCRFFGRARTRDGNPAVGYIDVTTISCVDDRGTAYELAAQKERLRRLGYVTDLGNIANEGVSIVQENSALTLRQGTNVVLRFDRPILSLPAVGETR